MQGLELQSTVRLAIGWIVVVLPFVSVLLVAIGWLDGDVGAEAAKYARARARACVRSRFGAVPDANLRREWSTKLQVDSNGRTKVIPVYRVQPSSVSFF